MKQKQIEIEYNRHRRYRHTVCVCACTLHTKCIAKFLCINLIESDEMARGFVENN